LKSAPRPTDRRVRCVLFFCRGEPPSSLPRLLGKAPDRAKRPFRPGSADRLYRKSPVKIFRCPPFTFFLRSSLFHGRRNSSFPCPIRLCGRLFLDGGALPHGGSEFSVPLRTGTRLRSNKYFLLSRLFCFRGSDFLISSPSSNLPSSKRSKRPPFPPRPHVSSAKEKSSSASTFGLSHPTPLYFVFSHPCQGVWHLWFAPLLSL